MAVYEWIVSSALRLMTGPMSVSSSQPGRSRSLSPRATSRDAAFMPDVDDAVRDACLDQQLDEALAEERRVRRRLEDDRVAAGERRQHLPRGDRDREVPRRDAADDADRHPDRHLELVAQL